MRGHLRSSVQNIPNGWIRKYKFVLAKRTGHAIIIASDYGMRIRVFRTQALKFSQAVPSVMTPGR